MVNNSTQYIRDVCIRSDAHLVVGLQKRVSKYVISGKEHQIYFICSMKKVIKLQKFSYTIDLISTTLILRRIANSDNRSAPVKPC